MHNKQAAKKLIEIYRLVDELWISLNHTCLHVRQLPPYGREPHPAHDHLACAKGSLATLCDRMVEMYKEATHGRMED